MSLVGPRPVTTAELAHYGPAAALYLSVPPGITGPWQISGRNEVDYAERVRLDADYVCTRSLWRDLVILWRTPSAVFGLKGAR
jgi:lipopolysaccharide/colanic/teichoic acid biosynthesis glycosyltransferase